MRISATVSMLSAGLALGACSGLPDVDSLQLPQASSVFRVQQVTSFRDKPLPPITPEDLVDGEGRCAGAFAPAESSEPGAAVLPSTVALEMSECEVVRRMGAPQQVDVGAGPGGERTASLTYLGGARPGIYRFAGGRLRSMERGPEPPQEAKPAKKPAKKKTANR